MLDKSRLVVLGMSLMFFSTCATFSNRGSARDQIIMVTVKKRDTLNQIAKRHNTTWQAIAMLNREQLSNGLIEGQELRVPIDERITSSVDSHQWTDYGDDEDNAEEFIPKRRNGLFFAPRSSNPPQLVMPAPGRVSSRFGKRGRKLHKGIDIVANVGTPIVAAADGEVIFSGRQRGYGTTLVVDHGQFMTLYAHASKLIARNGDRVRQGDFIAKVGRTGNARGAHLHFELRDQNNKPIDPLRYVDTRNVAQSQRVTRFASRESPLEFKPKSKRKPTRTESKQAQPKQGKKGLLYARD